jgi:hypothetical protein
MKEMTEQVNHLVKELQDGHTLIKHYLALIEYGEELLNTGSEPITNDPYQTAVNARSALMQRFPELEESGITADEFIVLTENVAKEVYRIG